MLPAINSNKEPMKLPKSHSFQYAAFWIAAVAVGVAAVAYAGIVGYGQSWYFQSFFNSHPYWVSVWTPFGFVLATFLVRRFAPDAKGSGIPQVLEAIELDKNSPDSKIVWHSQLVSLKTSGIKILSSLVGVLAGASLSDEKDLPFKLLPRCLPGWAGGLISGSHK